MAQEMKIGEIDPYMGVYAPGLEQVHTMLSAFETWWITASNDSPAPLLYLPKLI